MRRARSAIAAALVALVAVGAAAPATAATSTLLEPGAVDRVLVITTPGVGWSSIDPTLTPNLWRLLRGSAMGDLTARTLGRPDLASGYLTLGAGTRAVSPRSPVDGAGMEPTEPYGDVTARDAFRVSTGRDVERGVLQLGIEPILAANADQSIDVVIGALGDALAGAGHDRAVIANGDGAYPDQPDAMRRYAVSGLMGGGGVVPAGRAGVELLEAHERAPFGLRYDNDAVVDAFTDVWDPGAVVLVEGSDLVRADAFGLLATPEQASAAVRQALRRTDELVGRLLEQVDLDRDAVVVMSPTRARGTVLSAVAVHAPGVPAGLLASASTRRRGFVLLGDVAPTLLALLGLPRDDAMTGTRFTVGTPLPLSTRLERLTDATSAAVFRDKVRVSTTYGYAVGLAAILGLCAYTLIAAKGRRWRAGVIVGALAVLAYIPAVYLARLLPLYDVGTLAYWAFLVATSAGIALVARLATRRRVIDSLLGVLAVIVAVLVTDVITGARLQLSSAFGYSATVGIRVAGFGNIAYAVLGAAAVLLAGLVAHRIGGRRGAMVASAVMGIALLADIAPFWGSDVGGVLSLVPAFGVTALMLLGVRIRLTWRAAVIAGTATVVALAALTALDLSRPADARTHLGRLAQQVADQGVSPFTNTIVRKVDANLETWSTSEWRWVLAIAVVFLVYVAFLERDRVRQVLDAFPEMRAAFVGLVVLATLGYAFNDSGVIIPAVTLSIGSLALLVLFVGYAADLRSAPVRRRRRQPVDESTRSVATAASSQE
ncbi:MAG: hypothetical protein ABW033_08760 [Acidimicrobiia bacterium]